MGSEIVTEAALAPAVTPLQTVGDALNGAALARLNLQKYAQAAHFENEATPDIQADETPAPPEVPSEVETQTPSENPKVPAEAAAAEDDTDPLADLPLDAKAQDRINARIGKFKAEAATATEAKAAVEAELETVKARMAELEQQSAEIPPSVSSPAQPLAHVTTQQQLVAEQKQAQEAMVFAEDQLDAVDDNPEAVASALRRMGITIKDETGEEDFSHSRMRSFLKTVKRNAERTLRDVIPARAQHLQQVNAAYAEAVQQMPELQNAKSPQAQTAQRILKAFPQIQSNPNWPKIVMVHALGLAEYEKLIAAQTGPAKVAAKLPPKMAPKPSAAPATAKTKGLSEDVYERASRGDQDARLQIANNQLARAN